MTLSRSAWRFAALVPVFVFLPSCARAEYCAFEVIVKSPNGVPISGVGVSAQSKGDPFAKTVTDERGVARICDAPNSLVDVSVGGNLCGAVSVRYLESHWMQTTRVPVTYENCNGKEWLVPGGCMLTLRARNAVGVPLVGAAFKMPDDRESTLEQTSISDSFGRIFRFVRFREALNGSIEKEGYLPSTVRELCEPGGETKRELIIILRESPK